MLVIYVVQSFRVTLLSLRIFQLVLSFGFFAFLLVLLVSFSVQAKDFGIVGHTYEIQEENILDLIKERLKKIDLEKLGKKMQEKTKKYVENPPVVKGITKAKESKVFYYDPSYVLTDNIYDHQKQLIHPAGKVINPLEYIPLSNDLIFIDGDDESQVKLAIKRYQEKNGKAKIILIKGSPINLQKSQQNQIWIYFDQAGIITSKLGITEVPAFVEQEGVKLKIKVTGEKEYE